MPSFFFPFRPTKTIMLPQLQPWILITILSLLHIFSTFQCFPEADKIINLPGQPHVTFQQFAGYVPVDDKQQRALFYYLVEAESNPASKPLVLWLNGGPGCTSVGIGAFTEHGPFITNFGQSIVKNYYSWNKEANILYLESPAGVGFSYSLDESFYSTLGDDVAATDNLVFLERWFSEFPEYKNRDFYIMGESYAGHYAPQLAELIVKKKANFNLKGIAIGNPLLDLDNDLNAADEYLWSHGIISDTAYRIMTSLCNSSRLYKEVTSGHLTSDCIARAKLVSQESFHTEFIDCYYVLGDRCLSYNVSQAAQGCRNMRDSRLPGFLKPPNVQQTNQLDQQLDECNMKYADMYLNRRDVQKALHGRLVGTASYRLCSETVGGNYRETDREIPTIDLIGFLVKSGLRVIVYRLIWKCCSDLNEIRAVGIKDGNVPFLGTRRLVDGLAKKLGLRTTVNYSAWFVNKQVGGWTQVYGNDLTYATIRGASHSAPTTQPKRSFVLFNAFLHGKPLPKV